MSCSSILLWLVATEHSVSSGDGGRAISVKVGRLIWQAQTGCYIAFNNYSKKYHPRCTMGKELANDCLSASINSNSLHKRRRRPLAKRAESGLGWHTSSIKEKTVGLCDSVAEGRRAVSTWEVNPKILFKATAETSWPIALAGLLILFIHSFN